MSGSLGNFSSDYSDYPSILETSVIFVSRRDGSIIFASEASKKVFGFDPCTFIGGSLWSSVHEYDVARLKHSLMAICDLGDLPFRHQYRRKHHKGGYINVSSSTLSIDSVFITEEFPVEKNSHFSRKDDNKSVSIQGFFNPLKSIQKFFDLVGQSELTDEIRSTMVTAQKAMDEIYSIISNTVKDTHSISKNINDATRLDHKTFSDASIQPIFNHVSLSKLVQRCRLTQESLIPCITFNTKIEESICSIILSDENWLWQMVLSLLENAVQHSRQVCILLRVYLVSSNKFLRFECYHLSARDNSLLESMLFEPTEAIGDETMRPVQNSLYLMKQKTERLGGSCGYFQSQESLEARTYFQIPYIPQDGMVNVSEHKTSFDMAQVREVLSEIQIAKIDEVQISRNRSPTGYDEDNTSALVIEDTGSTRKLLCRALEMKGLVCETAKNGSEGLHSLQRNRYRIVLVDGSMPVMSGMECVHRFREWEKAQRIQTNRQFIVGISCGSGGFDPKNDEIDAYLSKPIDIKAIKELLHIIELALFSGIQRVC